ncbi:hypothetical protein GE21DRAFT_1107421 [Neurospora crassa]|nr:hypothetical protein GE21DRAFT_1107421 [Neurospora crassa]
MALFARSLVSGHCCCCCCCCSVLFSSANPGWKSPSSLFLFSVVDVVSLYPSPPALCFQIFHPLDTQFFRSPDHV